MNRISNKQAICDVLMERAKDDRDIVVLCSDSRGSASLSPFAEAYPKQFIEVGIAEQSLVSTAAGMALCGKRPFAASPACFLSTRGFEQIKVDCAYSGANVKLIGISGGVSYGALGMTHHSAQDIAALSSLPGMRVYLPSDRHQTRRLFETLCRDEHCAYIRVGRNAVEDVYDDDISFTMDKATVAHQGGDATIIACGELVKPALDAALLLKEQGVSVRVLDMYCIKPIDQEAIIDAARQTRVIVTAEEHSPFGGLGSIVSRIVAEHHPTIVKNLALPDSPVITGSSQEVFDYYGLNAQHLASTITGLLQRVSS